MAHATYGQLLSNRDFARCSRRTTACGGSPGTGRSSSTAAGIAYFWMFGALLPKRENVYRIDAIPLLGMGRVDLRQVKVLAQATAAT